MLRFRCAARWARRGTSLTRRSSSRRTRRNSSPALCCRWTADRARGLAAKTFIALPIAALLLSHGLRRAPEWRRTAGVLYLLAVMIMVSLIVFFASLLPVSNSRVSLSSVPSILPPQNFKSGRFNMAQVVGSNNNGDAVVGTSTGGGAGVRGTAIAANHIGVVGQSASSGQGVGGFAANGDGVRGESSNGGAGVRGIARGANHIGVVGQSANSGCGVGGFAANGDGARGESTDGGAGVRGIAHGANHDGDVGQSASTGNGVLGVAAAGSGIYGVSQGGGHGVTGIASYGQDRKITGGVDGLVASGAGVVGTSTSVSVIGLVNPGGWHPE